MTAEWSHRFAILIGVAGSIALLPLILGATLQVKKIRRLVKKKENDQ